MVEQFTQDMCQVWITPLTVPHGMLPLPLPSPWSHHYPWRDLTVPYWCVTLGELARRVVVGHLVHTWEPDELDTELRETKQRKILEVRPWQLEVSYTTSPTVQGPALYQLHLMPTPSSLCPLLRQGLSKAMDGLLYCFRICLWMDQDKGKKQSQW